MKLYRKLLLILTGLFFMVSMSAFADQPPDPGGGPGSGDDPVGGDRDSKYRRRVAG